MELKKIAKNSSLAAFHSLTVYMEQSEIRHLKGSTFEHAQLMDLPLFNGKLLKRSLKFIVIWVSLRQQQAQQYLKSSYSVCFAIVA
jgi:hypothetical protein